MVNLSYLMKWVWSFENIACGAAFRFVGNLGLFHIIHDGVKMCTLFTSENGFPPYWRYPLFMFLVLSLGDRRVT